MGRHSSMLVVFLLALVLGTSPAKAIDCKTAISNLFPCSNFLKDPNSGVAESSCCNAARKWTSLGDVDSLCKCLQPITSQFLPLKAQQLLGLCNLETASYAPFLKCVAPSFGLPPLPSENQEKNLIEKVLPPLPFSPLPPFGSLPPFPFVPLPPLPFGPLPPLPFGPLPPLPPLPPFGPFPPLPFGPPADNQN